MFDFNLIFFHGFFLVVANYSKLICFSQISDVKMNGNFEFS